MVETFKVMIVRKMMKTEVGKKIAAHCNGYDLFFTMRFNKENIEEEALKMVKSNWRIFTYISLMIKHYSHFLSKQALAGAQPLAGKLGGKGNL